ncbi:MAG: HAMP domain-containing protein [Desulfuromonadales bacterium]|nr:HAMP domain-containing protein [Desulfuromonadales bacterium]
MRPRFARNLSLSTKLFLSLGLLLALPLAILSVISFNQLRLVQDISLQGTSKALIDQELAHIEGLLQQEAKRLSVLFFRIRDETKIIASLAEAILTDPEKFHYRNGSQYQFEAQQPYIMPVPDGNSALFLHQYRPSLLPLIQATEALDLVWKPLALREPLMELAWLIHADGLSRTFPWRDFHQLVLPEWLISPDRPYFYLAGPQNNPEGKEIFTSLYDDDLSHKWMISCLSPVMVDGKHQATVAIDITIERLQRELSGMQGTAGTSSLLFSGSEIVAASANLPLALLGLDPEKPAFGQDLFASSQLQVVELAATMFQRETLIEFVELPGLRAYVGAAVIEPLRWRVMLIVPEHEIISPAHENAREVMSKTGGVRRNFISLILTSALAAGSIIFFVLVHQSYGLRTLLAGIKEFADGHLSHRIPVEPSELGQLGSALNAMAQSLSEKKQELTRIYGEVEQERKLSAVGRLAAGIAHEVNNPLATISTHTQLLLRREDIPAEAKSNLKKVMGEIKRIQGNMRNLLDLSRLQSPVRSEANPHVLIREITDLARHEAHAQGIELILSLSEHPGRILVDGSGFKQVLWNILGNAIQAQGKGGKVVVRTRFAATSSHFVMEVEDAGPGIPEELLPKVFDPFFTTKEVGQGTGLGLALAFRIVQAHGGKIEIENLLPRGCCFRVVLPRGV